ncbi:hypothetical protein CKM354_000253600 [Cercospora kikuchii]|uniref:Uncharacterized protein n=1 Tax=Cercospora kikuchii TaxID=84275 RepID=A0A9P3CFU8_9PEZI|nr:uncharacterized protein CKM354_000253600 [Cercospora kikuchii]GIZ39145.1 hypothetical protein CKM354_000253600 [Cercospora kikuchii]
MEFASPRWAAYDDTSALRETSSSDATYAVSAQYAAYANRRGVFARKLTTNEHYKRLFRYDDDRPWFQPLLAFSSIRGKLLAIATGVQILIFDLDTKKVKNVLKGNGRIITSLAWAESKPGILATGAVDGSICVWSLKQSARPLHHARTLHSACTHVAFHPKNHELIASCHKGRVSVWTLPSTTPFLVSKSKDTDISALRWFATDPSRVLGISTTGSVSIYDVKRALLNFEKTPRRGAGDGTNEDGLFRSFEDVKYTPASTFELGLKISQATLIGRNGLIVLPRYGHILYFITFFADKDEATELWRLRLDDLIDCFSLRVRESSVQIVACIGVETQTYDVPVAVLHGMGWDQSTHNDQLTNYNKGSFDRAETRSRTMRPEQIAFDRLSHSPPPRKPSVHDRFRRPHFAPEGREVSPSTRKTRTTLQYSPLPSMTSSLELPKPSVDTDEQDSPMPFLSPSIPARRTSTGHAITPLDESIRLPPRASFDSITSTAGHDSDSDDETFAEHMQGSGSFLPGGVNVPLPRTCGACFGPSGQLLMFFPTRVQPTSADEGNDLEEFGTRGRQDSEVTRLFPTFGNLSTFYRADVAVDSDGSVSPHKQVRTGPRLSMPTSSFGDTRWAVKVSPVKTTNSGLPVEQRIKVSVHEVKSLQSSQRLAYDYRILPEDGESASALCYENAEFAIGASMDEAAEMWRALAILLEQRICSSSDLALREHEAAINLQNQRPALSRNLSLASDYAENTVEPDTIKLHWLQHPMGKTWAVDRILRWAERQADVQLLACVSSLLIKVSEVIRSEHTGRKSASLTQHESYAGFNGLPGGKMALNIPLLRTGTELTEASLLDESPDKPYSSRTSSRDPSLPTTPYLESSASTPPLALPYFNRHSTRVSASGSASPETHRGSISAAAKYYAQTLSDKLAGYSTSPPARKLGTSPGNELSTSLPTATGSWSKSVSFAAASDAARDGRHSLSLTRDEEAYDSDRTIDELSLPRTPNPGAGVTVRELNGQSFWNDPFASPGPPSLMPNHFATKCNIWRSHYAEQLRSWDLIIEAAELENVSDLAGAKRSAPKPPAGDKVLPQLDAHCRGATCSICFCAIKAAKQLCPACLHTTHPWCLEDLLAHLDADEAAFTCPTGCGCQCLEQADVHFVLEDGLIVEEREESLADSGLRAQFAKKRSLTDPRLLRERLEGNSW